MQLHFTKENIEFLNKQMSIDKTYLKNANDILNGKYKLQNGLDIIEFNKLPDWNYKHSNSSNTYQLYLHTLNFITSLVRAYIKNQDVKYIVLAKSIVDSWIKENLNQEKTVNYAWYDHTISSRIQNLLYYQVNVPKRYQIKKKKFERVYDKHIDFLSKYKNYTENNHGIMMDRSLVISSFFLADELIKNEYLMLAKSRVEKAILRDYSYNDVHLENSPDYHRMVTNWLNKVVKVFDEIKMPLSLKYKIKLKNADKYNRIIINYNKEYPMIGDTSFGIANIKKEHINFVDYEAGIGVFNDRRMQSTLVFNCGYQNFTHKHYDDLSLTLSIEKEQILVDSGKYNYNKNDPIRQYFLSPQAHTTLFVKDKEYSLSYNSQIKIVSSQFNSDYKIIKGIHRDYDGIILERTIVFLNNGVYVIIDNATSDQENVYVQNFVFNDDIDLSILDVRKYLVTTQTEKQYVLQEHSSIAASKLLNGSKSNAMISKTFDSINDTNRLEIRKKQKNSSFLTTLCSAQIDINKIFIKKDVLFITIDEREKQIKLL